MSGRYRLTLLVASVIALNPAPCAAWALRQVPGELPPNPPIACESLDSVPIQFNIDYKQIHDVWLQGGCTGCHNVSAMGGLRLDVPTISILQLVQQPSFRDSKLIRAIPLNADYSLVYQMLNCTPPPTYPEMPPSMGGGRIAIALRARVHDWLAEGARGFDEDDNPVSDVLFVSPFESQRFQGGLAQ